MGSFKTWLIEVGVKKYLPSAIRAALGGIATLCLAHAGELAKWGITYNSATQTFTWQLHSVMAYLEDGAWIGAVTGLFAVAQHHLTALTSGTPQTGAKQ